MTNQHYILKGKEVRAVSLMAWAEWFETAGDKRIVKQTTLPNGKFVSTVFLGTDHNWGKGDPLLFETMVFPKKGNFMDEDMERYSTYSKAESGHKRMVKKHS